MSKIVGGDTDSYLVPCNDADSKFPQSSGEFSHYQALIIQLYAKASARNGLHNRSLELQ